MQTVIYADILFFMNTVITFLILLTTADIIKVSSAKCRYAAGAFAGGVFSFIILAPPMNFLLVLALRIIISILIILITFRIRNVRHFLKCVFGFFLISFLFAGIVYFISGYLDFPNVYYNNGFTYFDFSALSLIIITASVFLSVRIINKKILNKTKSDMLFNVEIFYKGNKARVCALYDTGNTVKDIYSGKPVIIVSIYQLEDIIDTDSFIKLQKVFCDSSFFDLPQGIRLLPVKTIGEKKLLPAFTSDKAVVYDAETNRTIDKACIALTDDTFGNNEYKALINDAVLGKVL